MKHAYSRKAVFGPVLLVICSVPGELLAQVPEGYELVTLSETSATPSRPHINNAGQVVWAESDVPVRSNLFLYTPGEGVVQLTDDSTWDNRPALNNLGRMAWRSGDDAVPPMFVTMGAPGELRSVLDGWSSWSVDINDAGWVVFDHDPAGDVDRAQVFLFDGDNVRQITDNGLSNQMARINNRGDIVWTCYNFDVSPWRSVIMLYRDGVIEQLTDWGFTPQLPSINDNGQVVWQGVSAPSSFGIHLWENGDTTLVVDGSATSPSINNLGQIAFTRWHEESQNQNIWMYDAGELTQLNMSSEEFKDHFNPDINDQGEIVWRYFEWLGDVRRVYLLRTCANSGGLPCFQDADCGVPDVCSIGTCECGSCTITPHTYGDLNADGTVDVLDILCVLDGFQGDFATCPFDRLDIGGCSSDGIIDLMDILGVLDAFAGQQTCCP